MSIDPTTATLTMHDRLETSGNGLVEGVRDDFNQFGHLISQYGPKSQGARHPLLNSFTTDAKYRLITREKNQELLRGEFGSIYAKTIYFYDSRYRGQATGFEVNGYSKIVSSDIPSIAVSIPPEAVSRLTAISIVRIVQTHPGFAVFAATYSPDGRLQSVSFNAARGGDWLSGGISYGSGMHPRPEYGVPRIFPVGAYTTEARVLWPSGGDAERLTAVHFHYDANRWIRQDTFVAGIRTGSRNLHFPSTDQDDMLAPIDGHRGFGSWTRAAWD